MSDIHLKISPPDIAKAIRRLIRSGEFEPGHHLGTVELAQRFGVSRGPIREALRILESRHLVRIVPAKGAFVIPLADEEAFEVMQLRGVLFGLLAELTAERGVEADLAELGEKLQRLEDMSNRLTATPQEFWRATIDYALVMHRAARSPRLARTMNDLSGGLSNAYGHLSFATRDMQRIELRAYRKLTRAIQDRNPTRAAQLAREMLADGVARARELQALMPSASEIVFKGRRRRRLKV